MKAPLDLAALLPEVDLIGDAGVRAGVIAVWEHFWQESEWQNLESMPIYPDVPRPHLPHNRAVVALALAAAEVFERFHGVRVDRDTLLAAALLQDASKLIETRPGADGSELTEVGRAYPHAFWAAHQALLEGLPEAVCRIVLTHTPYSSRFPDSLEGKILYYVDQLDVIAVHGDRWRKQLFITK
ncbi:MAG: hypothetical protein NVS9B1_01670 [Candidatus Dormibacteraceae bacterium]